MQHAYGDSLPDQIAPAPLDAININAARDELSPEGMLAIDANGKVVLANPAFTRIWRLTTDVLTRHDARALLGVMANKAADSAAYLAWMTELCGNSSDRSREEVLLADGRVVDQHSVPIAATEAEPGLRLWLFRDVTQIKRAAQRIDQAEARWRALVEQEFAGIGIILSDGSVAFSNNTFAALLGCKPQDITGRPLVDFLPPQERGRVAANLKARDAGARGINKFITQTTGHDGSSRDIMVYSAPVRHLEHDALLACTLDVSDMRHVERELTFANLIIEQSPVVIFETLAQEGFPRSYISKNVNRFGYTSAELDAGAFRFPDYVHPDDRPAVMATVQEMVEGRTDLFKQDYRLIGRDGSLHWIQDTTVAVRDDAGAVRAYRGTLIDVTERVAAEQKLRSTNRALRALSRANATLIRATCESELLNDMCRVLVENAGYLLVWVAFAEQDSGKTTRAAASYGEHWDVLEQLGLRWADSECGNGPSGRTIRTGQPHVNRDFATNPAMAPWRDECLKRGFGSSAALPLKNAAGTFGALVLVSAAVDAFDAEEMALLNELADHLSYGIAGLRMRVEHETLQRRLRRSLDETVQAIATTLELRDPYTAGHQKNVARLATSIAQAMGLPEYEIEGIALAASLHDIGKINVPSEILSKPGKLTLLEMRMIETHVRAGFDILKKIDFPWPVAEMVLQHHERLDGSGYPQGLHGDAILLGSKIIAVADVSESMTAHRPYRPALPLAAIIAELERGRSQTYYPAAVDACLSLLRQGDFIRSIRGDGSDTGSSPATAAQVSAAAAGPAASGSPRLTLQQSAVMQLLAQGRSIKEIARALDIGLGTVKTHLQLAYTALGAHNKVQAIARSGLLREAKP